jgi:cob(I)alamin adenosyltransferase
VIGAEQRYATSMKIYTRTGDAGTTALFGGERVPKSSPRVRAYGSVDEANALLGVARTLLDAADLDGLLTELQKALFDVGADLATPDEAPVRAHVHPIDEHDVRRLEAWIDRLEGEVAPLKHFVLPGGDPAAAQLHVARAVARRAEREVVALAEQETINLQAAVYLNRLSDLLFVLARVVNARHGVAESKWAADGRPRSER